ncbi:MAG: DUF116 domain-containing protein [Oscillospiraceae bacterium]|nr:DUF116 domain-containing protein [Oscillospiraceae bacterium]
MKVVRKLNNKTGNKRIFIGLLCAALIVLVGCFVLFVYMMTHLTSRLTFRLQFLLVLAVGTVVLLIALGVICILLTLTLSRPVGHIEAAFIKFTLKFYPLAMAIGKLLGIQKDQIRASFVEINNEMVRYGHLKVSPSEILVLLPHCLQNSACTKRVTNSVDACTSCGACTIGAIRDLCKQRGVNLMVVTGGTLARKAAKELRPKAVIAVACERDLFAGILDLQPLPSLGVVNVRPVGPCHDTDCNVSQIEEAIAFFLDTPATVKGAAL